MTTLRPGHPHSPSEAEAPNSPNLAEGSASVNQPPERGTRRTRDGPFCWQSKAALRLIREQFGEDPSLPSALGIYSAITEIASDQGTEEPVTTHNWIAHISGYSVATVKRRVAELESERFLEKIRQNNGGKGPCMYRLLTIGKDSEPMAHSEPSMAHSELPMAHRLNKVERATSEERQKNIEKRQKKGRAPRFTPPSLEEVQVYCKSIGLPESEAAAFIDRHETVGWVVGKARLPMVSWKSALQTWKRNAAKFAAEAGNGAPHTPAEDRMPLVSELRQKTRNQ